MSLPSPTLFSLNLPATLCIEYKPPAVEACHLNQWIAREVLPILFWFLHCIFSCENIFCCIQVILIDSCSSNSCNFTMLKPQYFFTNLIFNLSIYFRDIIITLEQLIFIRVFTQLPFPVVLSFHLGLLIFSLGRLSI